MPRPPPVRGDAAAEAQPPAQRLRLGRCEVRYYELIRAGVACVGLLVGIAYSVLGGSLLLSLAFDAIRRALARQTG